MKLPLDYNFREMPMIHGQTNSQKNALAVRQAPDTLEAAPRSKYRSAYP